MFPSSEKAVPEKRTQTWVAGAIALLLVAGVVGWILYSTRLNRVEVAGKVLQVRSHEITDGTAKQTLVIIDFRLHNPSTQQFVVRDVDVSLEQGDGKPLEGGVFAEIDAQRVFQYYPVLGQKYNKTLVSRDRIAPGETVDRMIGARFEAPDQLIRERRRVKIVVEELDRAKSEIVETR